MARLHLQLLNITFCLIIPFTAAISFNLTFDPNEKNVIYKGSASPAEGGVLQLTRNLRNQPATASFGRATYHQLLQLWDKASGNLTDFSTHFSFVIDSQVKTSYGDGLAFFLAPEGSIEIPPNTTKGSSLGLTSDGQELNTTHNQFVAVEFDIYDNPDFDPPSEHVGIDLNSMRSVANTTWFCDIVGGKTNEAWIRYDSITKNLSVAFTGFINNYTEKVIQYLSYVVDLRDYLPERVVFGFSAATGNASAIHSIYTWDVSSSLEIDRVASSPPTRRRRKKRKGLAVGLSAAGALISASGLIWLAVLRRRKPDGEDEGEHVIDEDMDDEFERGTGPRKFSYSELAHATNNFSGDDKLGEGGFGGVYKGFLSDINAYVAVKRVSKGSKQGVKEYASEVKIISRLRHRNLVHLIGWCHEKKHLLLVYEFMPNGSLDSHLFKGKSLLTWDTRYKIAQGLAVGLLYLHEGWEQCVVHRDIKSSNVMLDSDFNAKLGDFGLARLVDHGKGSQTTVLAGTMGYMAPECLTTGKASRESDVYSFGIVALEIACGRKPINPKAPEDQVNMVEWVWELYGEGKLLEAADPKLCGSFDEQEMAQLMVVGLWCAHPDKKNRPSIQQAIRVLTFEVPLPVLSSKMPVPTYFALPLSNSPFSVSIGATDSGVGQYSNYSYSTNSSQFTSSSSQSAASSSTSAALLHTR